MSSLAVNRKEEKQPGPDIADPAAFSLRFDVRAENEYNDIPAYVTQSFREMMKNIETATGGELYGVTLGGGILQSCPRHKIRITRVLPEL